jgi:hypothetical protein
MARGWRPGASRHSSTRATAIEPVCSPTIPSGKGIDWRFHQLVPKRQATSGFRIWQNSVRRCSRIGRHRAFDDFRYRCVRDHRE